MDKIIVLLIFLILFNIGFLSGCTQESNPGLDHNGNINHLIGTWGNSTFSTNSTGVSEYFLRIYNFTSNSYNYSYYVEVGNQSHQSYSDGTYELIDGSIILTNRTIIPSKKTTFKYSFSSNYSKLTLIDVSGQSIVYRI